MTVFRPDQVSRALPHWRIPINLVIAALVGVAAGPGWGIGLGLFAILAGWGKGPRT